MKDSLIKDMKDSGVISSLGSEIQIRDTEIVYENISEQARDKIASIISGNEKYKEVKVINRQGSMLMEDIGSFDS